MIDRRYFSAFIVDFQLVFICRLTQFVWSKLSIKCREDCRVLVPSRYLLFESQQWKHENNVWNLFKAINKDTRMILLTSFWFLYCYIWTDFTNCSRVSIVDFEQVNVGWVVKLAMWENIYFNSTMKTQK